MRENEVERTSGLEKDSEAAPGVHQRSGTRAYFSLPEDRSLEAYKHWIKKITASVGGPTVDDPVKDSEEVWERDWQTFWERIDAATRQQSQVAQESSRRR